MEVILSVDQQVSVSAWNVVSLWGELHPHLSSDWMKLYALEHSWLSGVMVLVTFVTKLFFGTTAMDKIDPTLLFIPYRRQHF